MAWSRKAQSVPNRAKAMCPLREEMGRNLHKGAESSQENPEDEADIRGRMA